MFWPDTGTGVDVEPARKPVVAAVRKFFTEGGVGVPPTVPGGDWFNQITSELLNVLAAAGIDPSKADDDQLLEAIKRVSNSTSAREALRRSYAEAGYTLVDGSFETGGTLTSISDVLIHEATGKAYSWAGDYDYPHDVTSETSPSLPGYVSRSNMLFRHSLPYVIAEDYIGSSDTAIIQSAINDAISRGVKYITYNRDYDVEDINNRQEVVFVGTNSITGNGSYRLRIIDGTESSMINDFGFAAANLLPSFSSKEAPVVVVVGDSLTTLEPNTIDSQHSLFAAISRKIKADNLSKIVTIYNRGIGGTVWYEIDTAAVSNWPEWYINHTSPWLDYVSDLSPDLVVISAGMNDSDEININNITSVITKIRAMPSSPDVLCMTTPVPSTEPGGAFNALFGTKQAQEGRDYAAGAVRSTCARLGVPIIDVNRQCNALRDGIDILESSNIEIASPTLVAGGFKSSIECRNWSATIQLSGSSPYSASTPLSVKVGPSPTDLVMIKSNAGSISLELFHRDSESPYEGLVLSTQPVPSVPHSLRIEVYNHTIRVFVIGSPVDSVPSPVKMMVGGGLYFPAIGDFQNDYNSGPLVGISMFAFGRHKKILPSLTNNQLWGVGDGTANTKLPMGGNGINHPTSLGSQLLYQDLFNRFDFSIPMNQSSISSNPTGGFETTDGVISRVCGRWTASSLAERFDLHIDWPVSIPPGNYRFIASGGVNLEDLESVPDARLAQTLINSGVPNAGGVDVTVVCLTHSSLGRYFDWELSIF